MAINFAQIIRGVSFSVDISDFVGSVAGDVFPQFYAFSFSEALNDVDCPDMIAINVLRGKALACEFIIKDDAAAVHHPLPDKLIADDPATNCAEQSATNKCTNRAANCAPNDVPC